MATPENRLAITLGLRIFYKFYNRAKCYNFRKAFEALNRHVDCGAGLLLLQLNKHWNCLILKWTAIVSLSIICKSQHFGKFCLWNPECLNQHFSRPGLTLLPEFASTFTEAEANILIEPWNINKCYTITLSKTQYILLIPSIIYTI